MHISLLDEKETTLKPEHSLEKNSEIDNELTEKFDAIAYIKQNITLKEVKYFGGKFPYTVLKLAGYQEIAAFPHALQKFCRYSVNNDFLTTRWKMLSLDEIQKMMGNNRGQREITRQILAITTLSEATFFILQTTGVVSHETAAVVFMANRSIKFMRHGLACGHAAILFKKALNNPEAPKVLTWRFTFTKGVFKAANLSTKIGALLYADPLYGYRHGLALLTGLMAMTKRRYIDPQVKALKKSAKAQDIEKGKKKKKEKARKEKPKKEESNYLINNHVYYILSFLAITTLVCNIYTKVLDSQDN